MLSAAAVCVSAEFFLITSQRSPTVVRQRDGRARGSEVGEVRRGGAGMRRRREEEDGERDGTLTGTGRQNYAAKAEGVRGEMETRQRGEACLRSSV